MKDASKRSSARSYGSRRCPLPSATCSRSTWKPTSEPQRDPSERGSYHRRVRQARSWLERKAWIEGLLERRTGSNVAAWNARVAEAAPADEAALRAWLAERG